VRLVRFTGRSSGAPRLGALVDGDRRVVDLRTSHEASLVADGAAAERASQMAGAVLGDTLALIEAGSPGLATARAALSRAQELGETLDAADVTLTAPLRPTRLRDCIAFETHMRNFLVEQNGQEIPPEYFEIPVYYKGNPRTVFGPGEEVPWPGYSEQWDYELELGVVLGREAVDVPVEEAEAQIFGLTCFNDFSARDTLRKEIAVGLGPGKAKDFATGLGPCLVTIDEIPDLYDLRMEARVNGETWSTGSTSDIHWRFDQTISRMSAAEPLVPGEIFGSGTVANGCGLELGRFLKDGDVVEIEIEHIGVLRNRVVDRARLAA
jgi:2-keto-4-pentenoate hydratase/2-oxohepta-3-ene-1,7-dioic acid hydratase in catechol pathway